MFENIFFAFVGTVAFSMLFNVHSRYYFYCGMTGAAGWLCYCLIVPHASSVLATFLGTMLVVLISRILAVWRRCPITVFLISGIFPLIPGTSVYNTAYYFVRNDLVMAAQRGIMALKLGFAIVLGIVIILSIPKEFFRAAYWRGHFRGKTGCKSSLNKI